jgi:excisionase family DNA binding protein
MKTKIDDNVRATYKITEAARVAGCGERTIRDLVKEGRIIHFQAGRNILIPKQPFHDWINSGGQTTNGSK